MYWIIPAYAGNTFSGAQYRNGLGDHPRVCGEHTVFALTQMPSAGSSPRMRGTLNYRKYRLNQRSDVGIIPAYAGNTLRD